jgi:hypothetical protein
VCWSRHYTKATSPHRRHSPRCLVSDPYCYSDSEISTCKLALKEHACKVSINIRLDDIAAAQHRIINHHQIDSGARTLDAQVFAGSPVVCFWSRIPYDS